MSENSDETDYKEQVRDDEDTIKELNALFAGKTVRLDETPAFNIRLIAEVKSRPYLYDHTDEGYNLITWRNNAWNEIGVALDSTAEHVKTRWKTLRDRYKKEEKKERQTKKASSWVFQRPLRFIQAHVRDRIPEETDGGLEEKPVVEGQVSPMEAAINFIENELIKNGADTTTADNGKEDSSLSAVAPTPPPAKRPRVSLTDQTLPFKMFRLGRVAHSMAASWTRLEDEEDEVFGHMIALKLSKLDHRTKEIAKMQVLRAIFDAQYGGSQPN